MKNIFILGLLIFVSINSMENRKRKANQLMLTSEQFSKLIKSENASSESVSFASLDTQDGKPLVLLEKILFNLVEACAHLESAQLYKAVEAIRFFFSINKASAKLFTQEMHQKLLDQLCQKYTGGNFLEAALALGTKHSSALLAKYAEKKGAYDSQNSIDNKDILVVPFIDACQKGLRKEVLFYLKTDKELITASGPEKEPLALAIVYERFQIAFDLIDYGIDIEEIDSYGIPMLQLALKNKNIDKKLITLLLNENTVNQKDPKENTALMIAAKRLTPDILHMLLDTGAQINAKSKKGKTAITNAIKTENFDAIKFLISKGCKIPDSKQAHFVFTGTANQWKIFDYLASQNLKIAMSFSNDQSIAKN